MKEKIQDYFDGREVKYSKNQQKEEVKESFIRKTPSQISLVRRMSRGQSVNSGWGTMLAPVVDGSNLGPTLSGISNDRKQKQVIKKCKNIREAFKEAIQNIADKMFALIRSKIQD